MGIYEGVEARSSVAQVTEMGRGIKRETVNAEERLSSPHPADPRRFAHVWGRPHCANV